MQGGRVLGTEGGHPRARPARPSRPMHRATLASEVATFIASACASPQPPGAASIPPPAIAASATAREPVPPAPAVPSAEAQFRAYLDAFNSGERAMLQAFDEKNRPGANLDDEMDFRSMTGGFDLKQVATSTATSCTGLVKERDSERV